MDILQQTKQLCAKYNIVPVRSRGQNFLIREDVYEKVVAAADLKPDDIVLEVGAGLGFLTEMMARKTEKVITVELDDALAKNLVLRLKELNIKNIEVVNVNILSLKTYDLRLKSGNYKIVANLPYNITSRFLRKFLAEIDNKPNAMVLMLQREVAERICARPGQMSLLAVSAQFYATPKIIARVPADAFWPKPKVESAIITLTPVSPLPVGEGKERSDRVRAEENFFKLVRAGFSAKRKQLQGNLAKGLKISAENIKQILTECGLKETARAQELSLADWHKLYIVLEGRNML